MTEIYEVSDGIFCFRLPLPDSPLKWLNCYIVKDFDGGRDLLIDCGYKRSECSSALMEALEKLGCTPENTDVFLTHMHDDHTGNASLLQAMGYKMLMGYRDYSIWLEGYRTDWAAIHSRIMLEGFPKDTDYTEYVIDQPRSMKSGFFCPELLEEGDILSYGYYRFVCIEMPGHTPGHMCLYDDDSKTMILGDHVLFDITPNICARNGVTDALGDYLGSLEKLRLFNIKKALTGHRSINKTDLGIRIDEIKAHHSKRLNEICGILKKSPGLSAYGIASLMSWSLRSSGWEVAPMRQKFFAMGETLAHLDHLVALGRVERDAGRKGICYYLTD